MKTREYNGDTQFQATFRSKFKPRIVEQDGDTDLDLGASEIGRGSKVSVQYKFRPWTGPGGTKTGIAQDLQMVQVLDMQSPNASQFNDDVDTSSVGDVDL